MPRNMSFMITTEQIKQQTKTVTRRLGWTFLKPGDILNACVKCMGLKKGERVEKLCQIIVTDVRIEALNSITKLEVTKEGFPYESPDGFIHMFMKYHKLKRRDYPVTRIEFRYLLKST